MKKNKLYIIIAAVLVAIAAIVILWKTEVFHSNDYLSFDAFAVKDTSSITKVFMADMHGNNVLLQRKDGEWVVCDSIRVMGSIMEEFLTTLNNLSVKQVVPKAGQNAINKVLSTSAVKVEIYQKAPKFKLFGIKFFVKERLTKTYYMGPATMDNLANFALLEGSEDPYIVYIPGFRGFATPIYSTNFADWINHDIFQTKITRIKQAEFIDYDNPSESFKVVKTGARFFDVYDYQGQKVAAYDTLKLIDMLSEFRDKNFEDRIMNFTTGRMDSVYHETHFKTIIITNTDGEKTTLEFCRQLNKVEYEDGSSELIANEDNCYGFIDHKYDAIYLLQFFHFDRQLQPLSYFAPQTFQK